MHVCVCAWVCMQVWMSVWERERVCVWVRARERESEWVCVCMCVWCSCGSKWCLSMIPHKQVFLTLCYSGLTDIDWFAPSYAEQKKRPENLYHRPKKYLLKQHIWKNLRSMLPQLMLLPHIITVVLFVPVLGLFFPLFFLTMPVQAWCCSGDRRVVFMFWTDGWSK